MGDAETQFCPIAQASEVVAEKWTPLILRELLMGVRRFSELQRGIPLVSPALLSKRLSTLERAGIVDKREVDGDERGYEYVLTRAGEELRPVIVGLGEWGLRWLRRKVEYHERDAAVLMWDVRRRIAPGQIEDLPVVIHFELRGVPQETRLWWLVVERDGGVDLCLKPPGHEVDLSIVTALETMIDVWLGYRALGDVIDGGEMRIEGDCQLCESIEEWLGFSVFADTPRPENREDGAIGEGEEQRTV